MHHAGRNHFSRWLKARTEFALAEELRPRTLDDYASPQALRESLIRAIAVLPPGAGPHAGDGLRPRRLRPLRRLLPHGRGLARRQGARPRLRAAAARGAGAARPLPRRRDRRARLGGRSGPTSSTASWTTTTCATSRSSARTTRRSRRASARPASPTEAERDVAAFLERATWPLAVRSSSLLEDSQHQPFTGVYETLMLANNAWSLGERLDSRRARHQARLRVDLLPAREGLPARDTLPPGGGEDGGDPPAHRGHGARDALLPGLLGRRALAQLLPDAAARRRGRDRGGGARDGAGGRRRRRVPALLPAPSPQHPAVLFGRGDAWRRRSASSGRSRSRAAARTPACASRPSTSRPRRPTGRWRASARPTRPRTRRSTTASRGPAPRLVTFAPVLKHGVFPLPEVLATLMAGRRARDGHPGRDRVRRVPGRLPRAASASSGSCRCARSR